MSIGSQYSDCAGESRFPPAAGQAFGAAGRPEMPRRRWPFAVRASYKLVFSQSGHHRLLFRSSFQISRGGLQVEPQT